MPAPHHRDCLMSMQAPQPNRRGRDAQAGRSGHSCETGVGRSAFERARVRAYSVATSSKVVLPTVKSGPLARLPWGGPRPRRPRSSVRPLARSRPHPRRPRLPRPRRRRRAVVTPPVPRPRRGSHRAGGGGAAAAGGPGRRLQQPRPGRTPGCYASCRASTRASGSGRAPPELADGPGDPTLPLASILSFRHPRMVARDHTVKYRRRTLQLPPGPQRTSYAWARVEVVERPSAELTVQHHGETTPPARLRRAQGCCGRLAPSWPRARTTSASPQGSAPVEPSAAPRARCRRDGGGGEQRGPRPDPRPTASRSAPTPGQLACWNAIQQARLQGLSMRATARLPGISRMTVRNHIRAHGVSGSRNGAAVSSDGQGGTDGVAAPVAPTESPLVDDRNSVRACCREGYAGLRPDGP